MTEEPEKPEIPASYTVKLSKEEYCGAIMTDFAPSRLKVLIYQFIIGGVSGLSAYILCSFFVEDFDFNSAIWFFAGAAGLSCILLLLFSPSKTVTYPDEDSIILRPTTYRFDADAVTIDIEKNSRTVMPWSHVHEVSIDTSLIRIYLDPVVAYYLPLDQVRNTEDPYALYTRLKGYWTDAQPKKETGSHATSAP